MLYHKSPSCTYKVQKHCLNNCISFDIFTLYTKEMTATLSFLGKMTSTHLYEISIEKLILDKAVG